MSRALSRVAVIAGALVLTACEPKVVRYELELVTEACEGPAPLDGVTHLFFRVTGDGMEPIERTGSIALGRLEIPDIPAGTSRQLEVRGYEGTPPGGRVRSLGRSIPFDVPVVVPPRAKAIPITVFLRRVNAFTRPSLAASPATCTRMIAPRAGHSATSLPDGRVMIAGGEQLVDRAEVTLRSIEYFNPAVGSFEASDDALVWKDEIGIEYDTPRAFHSATLLANGQVMIAGGEQRDAGGAISLVGDAMLFDPSTHEASGFPLLEPRSRHASAFDAAGRVILAGGRAPDGTAIASGEWFDPVEWTLRPIDAPVGRVGATAVPVQSGQLIALAGGGDGLTLTREVVFLHHDGETFTGVGSAALLQTPRRSPAVALFRGNTLVVAGGYDSSTEVPEETRSLSTTELILPSALTTSEGPVVNTRGDACAVTLDDGRVLIVGGRTDDAGLVHTDDSADLVTATPGGGTTVLGMSRLELSRYQHSCTLLADGTVLVAGGVYVDPTTRETLQDAVIFTPAPLP